MRAHIRSMLLFATMTALPVGLAAAQVAPAPARDRASRARYARRRRPLRHRRPLRRPRSSPRRRPPPVVLPPPLVADQRRAAACWPSSGISAAEGLDPRDYDPGRPDQGAANGRSDGDLAPPRPTASTCFRPISRWAMSAARTALAGTSSTRTSTTRRQRRCWTVALAHASGRRPLLQRCLPTHPQYGALKTALIDRQAERHGAASTASGSTWTAGAGCRATLATKYIIVNVPAFHATLVENGVTRWKHRAIAGAIKTPTPQLNVMATGVILNPWWEVPPSITKEVAGKPGYVALKGKDGKVQRWRQPPGPNNALGQLKFVMYNPYNIYLHDTNARSRFNSQIAARSVARLRADRACPRPGDAAAGRRWRRMDAREDRGDAGHEEDRSRPISSSRCRSISSISAPPR